MDLSDGEEVERDGQRTKSGTKKDDFLSPDGAQGVTRPALESSQSRKSYFGIQNRQLSSSSTPDLSRLSHLTADTRLSSHSGKSSGKSSGTEEDDDDDIPLGILAAHGFPSKHKSPSRLDVPSLAGSNRRGSMPLSAPPLSQAGGETRPGPKGSLPVFARNLPQDPYYGASLREQHHPMPGAAPPGGFHPGHVHPSGLVGVIAGEEQARAMRRGTSHQYLNNSNSNSNSNNNNYLPGHPHPGMMGRSSTMANGMAMNSYPGVGSPGGMFSPSLSPGDQAQLQMAQQMNQMMQMQMHWMQQIAQMQQTGSMAPSAIGAPAQQPGMMPSPQINGMPSDLGSPTQRPFSMPLPESSGPAGRAMNLTPPTNGQWNRNSSYTPSMNGATGAYVPSLAPSERNTIGMASRYRPVSIMAEPTTPANPRASTFTAGAMQSWGARNGDQGGPPIVNNNNGNHNNPSGGHHSSSTPPLGPASSSISSAKSPSPNPNNHPNNHADHDNDNDDDDDDRGWAAMKQLRDKKKSVWRLKKRERIMG